MAFYKKNIKKLDYDLFSNDKIIFITEDSNYFTFCSNKIGILSVYLNNINFDDFNFNENNPKTIIHIRFMAWRNKFNQLKAFKKK